MPAPAPWAKTKQQMAARGTVATAETAISLFTVMESGVTSGIPKSRHTSTQMPTRTTALMTLCPHWRFLIQ
jgi:hypothetical protein